MATCNLDELIAQACNNGFSCLDPKLYSAIELQLWYQLGGNDSSLAELIQQACDNGFVSAAEISNLSETIQIQLLCNVLG